MHSEILVYKHNYYLTFTFTYAQRFKLLSSELWRRLVMW